MFFFFFFLATKKTSVVKKKKNAPRTNQFHLSHSGGAPPPLPEFQGKVPVTIRIIFGKLQSERQKLHHPALVNLHELAVLGREDQRWWMSKIHESKITIRMYFTIKHGRNLLAALFLAPADSIPSGD